MSTPSMPPTTFNRGDRVTHPRRPEWGTGTVKAARGINHHGTRAQRLEVQFPHKGRVTINTAVAPLLAPSAEQGIHGRPSTPSKPGANDSMNPSSTTSSSTGGWLASISGNNDQSHELWDLPDALKDPFASRAARLKATLQTYRYSTEPRALIEWAVMQTGLSDPLSKYTRPELEQAFPRFARDRDQHMKGLIRDMKRNGEREELRLIANKTQHPAARSALDKAIRN